MGTLYVLEQGASIHRHRERLVVRREQAKLMEIALLHVDQVVLFGGVHLTTPAASLLLDREMPVALCSLSGRLRGFLQPAYDRWTATRCEQVRRSDDPVFRLAIAKELVGAKIRNSRSYLRRLERDGRANAAQAADGLGGSLAACAAVDSEDVLRGIEGAAAARYFSVLGTAFGELTLGRRGRGASEPGGALLNLSYGLLLVEVLRAVQLAGLDPFVGFYHRPNAGRPNLVLDLMEEWRPVVADSTALSAVRRRVITKEDFQDTVSGLRLTNKAMKRFLAEFHRRCDTVVTLGGRGLTYREWIDDQAKAFSLGLRQGGAPYKGFVVP